jgi:hypothetical protein
VSIDRRAALPTKVDKALNYGYRRRLVSHSVARFVGLRVGARWLEPGRSLTVDQAKQLLDATADDRLHARALATNAGDRSPAR